MKLKYVSRFLETLTPVQKSIRSKRTIKEMTTKKKSKKLSIKKKKIAKTWTGSRLKRVSKETRWLTCWCGCSAKFHQRYVEYTGYACTNCDRCNDFGLTVDE